MYQPGMDRRKGISRTSPPQGEVPVGRAAKTARIDRILGESDQHGDSGRETPNGARANGRRVTRTEPSLPSLPSVAPVLTVGVEEEYLLLDSEGGFPVPESENVRSALRLMPSMDHEDQSELLQAQIEVATPVCQSLQEVGENLTRLRTAVAGAVATTGCRMATCGAAPLRGTSPVPVTPEARYQGIYADARQLADEQLINGMHVHVAVPDRDSGIGVLNRIRPWLPVLVALGANSPFWDGVDTGFASWRTLVYGRWPASGPPPVFLDAADYEARTQSLLDAGVIRDLGQVYWHARLSERYPTIEVRAVDVQLEIQDAVTLVGIIRALVDRSLREHRRAVPLPPVTCELADAATWQAARRGLDGPLVDPLTGGRRSPAGVLNTLMHHISPVLRESGDFDRVASGVQRLLRQGNSAQRQRRAFADGGIDSVLELITGRHASLGRIS